MKDLETTLKYLTDKLKQQDEILAVVVKHMFEITERVHAIETDSINKAVEEIKGDK